MAPSADTIPILPSSESPDAVETRINIDRPRWDLNTFVGRLKYYAWCTDTRALFTTTKQLEDAKKLLQQYR